MDLKSLTGILLVYLPAELMIIKPRLNQIISLPLNSSDSLLVSTLVVHIWLASQSPWET